MARKVVVAIGIFAVLFITAWWANEVNERRYYIEYEKEQVQLFMIDEDENYQEFRPREYIKIKR